MLPNENLPKLGKVRVLIIVTSGISVNVKYISVIN